MIELEWPRNSGRIYTCVPYAGNCLRLTAKPGQIEFVAIAGEKAAISWLCDRSLRKSKAKALVAAALAP